MPAAPRPSGEGRIPDYARYADAAEELLRPAGCTICRAARQLRRADGETKATIDQVPRDETRYEERENIAREIEKIRTTLAEHGSGSRLNMLVSQDQRFELLRSLEYSNNSLTEAEQTLVSLTADRDAFVRQWSSQLSQDLVSARNNLDVAKAELEKATKPGTSSV